MMEDDSRDAARYRWLKQASKAEYLMARGAFGLDDAEIDRAMQADPCQDCGGTGQVPFKGTPGSYYRDGEKYDPPGWTDCETCRGSGTAT